MIATETLHFKRLARIRELVLSCKDQLPSAAVQYTGNLNASVNRLAELVGVQGSIEATGRAS